jgi:hypothetical protein
VTTSPLVEALAAEHAAIYAYGPVGVWLGGHAADTAREVETQHRRRRDALVLLLEQRGAPGPVPAPAYELPFPLSGADDALRLAILVEERVAAVWRALLPVTAQADRELALVALVEAAVAATRWRVARGVAPPTVPFPGDA